jgi:hypothetical protein
MLRGTTEAESILEELKSLYDDIQVCERKKYLLRIRMKNY